MKMFAFSHQCGAGVRPAHRFDELIAQQLRHLVRCAVGPAVTLLKARALGGEQFRAEERAGETSATGQERGATSDEWKALVASRRTDIPL